MAEAQTKPVTVEEFLAFEGEGDTRYQLIDGVIVAMAPGKPIHSALKAELARLLGNRVPRECRVLDDVGIRLPHTDASYYVADIAVTCLPLPSSDQFWIDAPRLVLEVLSPSTEAFDRTTKIGNYVRHPTVEEIVLVSTQRRRIDVVRRGDNWAWDTTIGSGVARIASFDLELSLDELYAGLL